MRKRPRTIIVISASIIGNPYDLGGRITAPVGPITKPYGVKPNRKCSSSPPRHNVVRRPPRSRTLTREMSLPHPVYKTALVTGASSGIGRAAVQRLCADGLVVHALARDASRLKELAAQTGCIAHAIDVSDTAALTKLSETLEIDVLVNSAGQSRQGDILNTTETDVDTLVDVNLTAILHLVRLFVPGMKLRNRGHVINITSIAGHYALPGGNTTYHASKAGVHALSQQLRTHLFGTLVRVTELSPARVETEVFARLLGNAEEAHKRFFEEYESLLPSDLADSITFVLNAHPRMNVTYMEVVPTLQVIGGLNFAKGRSTEI